VTAPPAAAVEAPTRARALPAGETAPFLALLALYVGAHLTLRLVVSPTLTIDDSREAMFAQSLAWGYLPRQPPLYNWLVWVAFRLVGVGLLGLALVKYTLLALAFGFIYLTGRRVLGDGRLAALGAFSLLLMIPVNWVVHETLTHSVAALAASAGTFYALLRLERSGSVAAYLAFGAALGLGVLSKFSYAFFAAALLLAGLATAPVRRRLLHPRTLLSAAVLVALVGPFFAWFYGRAYALAPMYADEVGAGEVPGYLRGVASGTYFLARVSFYYLTPLWIVFLAVFRGAWAPRAAAPALTTPAGQLLERFLLAELTLLVAGVLVGGVTYLKFRWMLPVYCLCPLYALARVRAEPATAPRLGRLALVIVAAEVLVLVAIPASVLRGDWLGRPSRLNTPYDAVARAVAAAGFTGGTIVAGDGAMAGNLRLAFPRARAVRLTNPDYIPSARGGGQCLVVWEKRPLEHVPHDIRDWIRSTLGTDLEGAGPIRVIDAPYHHARHTVLRVAYVLLPEGRGRCG
jgi:4-amino-4-deoxy-L-arabinose transferase-like glycosyltransferase